MQKQCEEGEELSEHVTVYNKTPKLEIPNVQDVIMSRSARSFVQQLQ